jgi:hypothetical protein
VTGSVTEHIVWAHGWYGLSPPPRSLHTWGSLCVTWLSWERTRHLHMKTLSVPLICLQQLELYPCQID